MEWWKTVTIIDFLAMSVGILGLFIGFSALIRHLSVIEIFYYPFLRLFCVIRRMNTENDESQSGKYVKIERDPNETSNDTKTEHIQWVTENVVK